MISPAIVYRHFRVDYWWQ